MPPPEGPKPQESSQDTGNVWEQTKKEIFSSPAGARGVPGVPQELRTRQAQRLPYDAQRVAEFKEKLIESLKQASNIRTLHPEDSVTVAVTAPGVQPIRSLAVSEGVAVDPQREAQMEKLKADQEFFLQRFGSGDRGESFAGVPREQQRGPAVRPMAQNCLIVKAKKADIDEFAKGAITPETFKQRLEMITY
jgi:hypothetical protein